MVRVKFVHRDTSATKIAALVLGAGGSERLGRPKQLVQFEGQTLIRRATVAALNSRCDYTVVLLGASSYECLSEVGDLPVDIVRSSDWRSGMSASIVSGIRALAKRADIGAVIITLVDQPLVTSESINSIIDRYNKTNAPVVTSAFDSSISVSESTGPTQFGPPTLFARSVFSELMALDGDSGARSILTRLAAQVEYLSLPEAAYDIDTEDDLQRISNLRAS